MLHGNIAQKVALCITTLCYSPYDLRGVHEYVVIFLCKKKNMGTILKGPRYQCTDEGFCSIMPFIIVPMIFCIENFHVSYSLYQYYK